MERATGEHPRAQYAVETQAKHAEAFGIAAALADCSQHFLSTIKVDENDGLTIVKGCLLMRLISGLEALCLLASHGYYTEALGQQRGLMEALARLAALSKEPGLLDEYLMQDQLNRQKVIGDIIEFRKDWEKDLPRVPSDDDLRMAMKEIEVSIDAYNKAAKRKLRDIKTFDWAAKGKVDYLLLGSYTISSQSLHHAPRDLERRLIVIGEKLRGIALGPERGNVDHLVLSSCKFAFVGLQWFAQSIDIELSNEVEALYKRYESTYERMAADSMSDAQ